MTIETDILKGKKCPYCGGDPEYVDSSAVYNHSYGMIYLCRPCNAWVGVHKGTDKALGRLANAELREAKKEAHAVFDRIWKERLKSRPLAYKWLSEKLGTPSQYTHIGMFDPKQCKQVVEICNNELNAIQ